MAWSRSKPINPDFATLRRQNIAAGLAVLAALLLHAFLMWFLLEQTVRVVNKPAEFNVELIRLPPPVQKPKPAKLAPKVRLKPMLKAVQAPLLHPKIRTPGRHAAERAAAPPPVPKIMHFNAATANTGLGLDLATPYAGTGQGSTTTFANEVTQRIVSLKTYPPGLPDYHGMKFWNQCIEEYRVTVARNGALINYALIGSCNPFLDAAARAAILEGAPYPVPPDFGGTEYTVFGSLVFKKPQ